MRTRANAHETWALQMATTADDGRDVNASPIVTLSEGVRRPSRRMTGLKRPCVLLSTRANCGARGTPAPQSSLQKKRKWKPGITRRSRRALGATSRGGGWPGRTLAFGSDTRRHGGGGRRPSPTPPLPSPCDGICVYLRYLRFLLCDGAMAQIRCDGSVSSAKSVSKKCDGCDDFACDAFASSSLRACDACDVAMNR